MQSRRATRHARWSDFTITAQREGDYAPVIVVGPVDPFTGENTCTRPMPEGIAGCAVNGKRGAGDHVETIGAFDLEARD